MGKLIESYQQFLESTTHYYPSTSSDDGVWDYKMDLMKSLSPAIEKELQRMKKEMLEFKHLPDYETEDERRSLNHWQWATMVTGLLQDGFLIKLTTLKEALEFYDKAIELAGKEAMDAEYIKQLQKSREGLNKAIKEEEKPSKFPSPTQDAGLAYKPGFMEEEAEAEYKK